LVSKFDKLNLPKFCTRQATAGFCRTFLFGKLSLKVQGNCLTF
jgi:hypothetical protein